MSAGGMIHGTGFTRQGRETLQLTLVTASGRLTIEGQSALLPGFSAS
ncbi:MAG TPA: hypothetical protein VKU89_02700 [Solirubrobacteraceae bacterium]|nr:hypothetical protein [Solirubrobacteraceae bacterium]